MITQQSVLSLKNIWIVLLSELTEIVSHMQQVGGTTGAVGQQQIREETTSYDRLRLAPPPLDPDPNPSLNKLLLKACTRW